MCCVLFDHMKNSCLLWICLLAVLFGSCERELRLDLPVYEQQMVVECYLEKGLPYILSLTESVSFFDADLLPVVDSALVTITHKGEVDTLSLIDTLGVYVDLNLDLLTAPEAGDTSGYYLYVEDLRTGRTAHANTRFLREIPIDTAYYFLNELDTPKAAITLNFTDPTPASNYYKVYFDNGLGAAKPKTFTWSFSDQLIENGEGTRSLSHRFKVGSEVRTRLYHIDSTYYHFLESVDDAIDAGGISISRPARVEGNINGGLGIFTATAYDEWLFLIEE